MFVKLYKALREFKPPPRNMIVSVRNVKLVHNIEIWLITKIVGIVVLTPSEQ